MVQKKFLGMTSAKIPNVILCSLSNYLVFFEVQITMLLKGTLILILEQY
jgi:hypothetical protein